MPSDRAASRARSTPLEANATTSDHSPRCIAGITFLTAMFAAPRTPQRILSGMKIFSRNYASRRSLLEDDVVYDDCAFGRRALVAVRSDGDGSQLLQDVLRRDARLRPFGLEQRLERNFVGVQAGRDLEGRLREGLRRAESLPAALEFEPERGYARRVDLQRDELVVAHVVGHGLAVLVGLAVHLDADARVLVRRDQLVVEGGGVVRVALLQADEFGRGRVAAVESFEAART